MDNFMEAQIHQLEHDAYRGVLRAFKAQTDTVTWEMEGLLTDLRKELRLSNDEHSELLKMVQADDVIGRIREWRQGSGHQPATLNNSQPVHDVLGSSSYLSDKKQKRSQAHGHQLPALSAGNSMQHPPSGLHGNRQLSKRMFSTMEPAEAARCARLIGRKVWIRWPDDNTFYEALITKFDAHEGRHALVYDIDTVSETTEWVNLKEIPPEDIKWNGEGTITDLRHASVSNACKRRRSSRKHPVPLKDDIGVKIADDIKLPNTVALVKEGERVYDDIELLKTEELIKEVERVYNEAHPDPLELKNAKKLLKEHEQILIYAIGRLDDPSDGKSDGDSLLSPRPPDGVPLLSHGSPDGVMPLSPAPAHGDSPSSPGAPNGDPPSLSAVGKG